MNYLFSLEIRHQYLHCSVTRTRPEKVSSSSFVLYRFLLKVANYICNNKPFVWFPLPRHCVHPLKSRYIALPCANFISYLKYGSASVEDDFYVFYCGDPLPLFNTQLIWISVCLALHVSTAFLRLHPQGQFTDY